MNFNSVNPMKVAKYAAIIVTAFVVIAYIWPFYSVPTGSRGVVTQFGKIVGIEAEGLAVLPPWQKLNNFSIRAEQADVDKAEGFTSDTQPVAVDLTVRYAIAVDRVAEVYEKYSHNGDLSSYVDTATEETFKAVTAHFTAVELVARRSDVRNEIIELLRKKLDLYGAQVINIDMRNFSFSQSYMQAINDKVTQEQKRLVAENTLLTVESEQKQKVVVAEADASAVRAKADGDAYQVKVSADAAAYGKLQAAEAEAKSLKIQNDALAQNKDVLELRRIQVEQTKASQWDGKLPQAIYAAAPIPFININK